jgi:hypothetical protein
LPYANVFRAVGFNPTFDVGRVRQNVVVRPIPNVRHASSGGNASTDLAKWDAYALDNLGNAYRAGPNDTPRGICIGFVLQANPNVMNGQGPISVDYVSGSPSSGSWPNLIGIEDNGAEFAVQADTFAASQVGASVNLLDAAPDSFYRQSRQSIIVGTPGTQFKVIALLNSPAMNAYGSNAVVVVRMLTALQG